MYLVICMTSVVLAESRNLLNTFGHRSNSSNIDNGRIVDGKAADVGQIPWQVAIEVKKGMKTNFCGGSLISEEWVLTSAQCIKMGDKYDMHFGGITTDVIELGRVHMVSRLGVSHPDYIEWNRNFDVGLIKLPSKIRTNNRIKTIKLPEKGQNVGMGVKATVSGWGKTKDKAGSRLLKYINVTSILNLICRENFGKDEIIESSLCCKGEMKASPCDGDNGGPLFTTNSKGEATLIGVYSFVHHYGCETSKPSVYVRTALIIDWITTLTGIKIQ